MNALQPWHLIILVVVLVLLFGAKRLPDAARSVGKSMKIFKAETKDMRDKDQSDSSAEDVETKQLPQAQTSANGQDKQVEELQRQLDELKRQQGASEAAHKNAG
jgi:sec-independent protein translocase protein TatA